MEEKENTSLHDVENLLKNEENKKKLVADSIEYIDIDNIKFVKSDVAKQQASLLSIFNAKPSFQVTCSQSGYSAKLSALVYRDIVSLTNSNLSNYEYKKETYKILFNKITGYSAEGWKPTFDDWLKATSLGDVDTLFYGIYCATFQDTSTIRYTCPMCQETTITTIDNKMLVRVEDRDEMIKLTKQIAQEADTYEKICEFSSVSNNKANSKTIRLPESKIIFVIKLPTLYKTLNILKTFTDEEIADKSTDALNILLATDKVAIPDEDGNYSYIESQKDIFALIDLLSLDDFAALKEVTTTLAEDKHITYCVENQKCPECGHKTARIPLDMESLLFFQITEKRLS